MSFLYVTADRIAETSGGGLVTYHESEAMRSVGECEIVGRSKLLEIAERKFTEDRTPSDRWRSDPWTWDDIALQWASEFSSPPKLAHFYAGTFSRTIDYLKKNGCKISYTAAAHDVTLSRQEHAKLGIPYDYPHLIDPSLWKQYVEGYLNADVLVCPSIHSSDVMREFGYNGKVEIIPHGCMIPDNVQPLPARFTVGYLGSYGPDKGVIYLLQAWKELNYKHATLVLAGRESTSEYVRRLFLTFGGGNVEFRGWVNDVADFYNSISLLVQPSVSEGFGIEVLEALAHGRLVLCSEGAGAADVVIPEWRFPARDVKSLAGKIECFRLGTEAIRKYGEEERQIRMRQQIAEKYTWEKIRSRYVRAWKEMLA